jgi:hypothetical protein
MGGASEAVKKCLMWLLNWNKDPWPAPHFNALYKIFLLWNKTVRFTKKTGTLFCSNNFEYKFTQQNKHSYTTSILKISVDSYMKTLLKSLIIRLQSKILALELNIQTVTTLYNYTSFTYCTQILTSSNSYMYRCYDYVTWINVWNLLDVSQNLSLTSLCSAVPGFALEHQNL